MAGLATDIGFDPVDVGALSATRWLERLLEVMVKPGGFLPDRPIKVLRPER